MTRLRVLERADAAVHAFVRDHPQATPFHMPEWADAVAAGCGQPTRWLCADAGGELAGVLPLTAVHSPFFGRALVSSGFGVGGGMLLADATLADAMGEGAQVLAHRWSCPSVELRGGPVPTGWRVDRDTYLGHARPLAADDDAELRAVPRKERAEVRRALGNGLEVRVGRGGEDLRAHYGVYAESVRNLGTPVFPRRLFAAMIERFPHADILTVSGEGRPLASVLSLYHRGAVLPYWGGGVAAARTWRANDLMYFALMRHAREQGCTRFDFGRSKAGTGAAAFKRNWGFEGTPLAYGSWSDGTSRSVNPLDPQFGLAVRLWRHLPLALANRVGPVLARGLG